MKRVRACSSDLLWQLSERVWLRRRSRVYGCVEIVYDCGAVLEQPYRSTWCSRLEQPYRSTCRLVVSTIPLQGRTPSDTLGCNGDSDDNDEDRMLGELGDGYDTDDAEAPQFVRISRRSPSNAHAATTRAVGNARHVAINDGHVPAAAAALDASQGEGTEGRFDCVDSGLGTHNCNWRGLDAQSAHQYLLALSTRWGDCFEMTAKSWRPSRAVKLFDAHESGSSNMSLYDAWRSRRVGVQMLEDALAQELARVRYLWQHHSQLPDRGSGSAIIRVSSVIAAITRSLDVLRCTVLAQRAFEPGFDISATLPSGFERWDATTWEFDDSANVIRFALRELEWLGCRRWKRKVYIPISFAPPTAAAARSCVWRVADDDGDLPAFLQKMDTIERRHLPPAQLASTAAYLASCAEPEFRELGKDRSWFAFPNGLYCINTPARFYKWDDPSIPVGVVACRHFEEPLRLRFSAFAALASLSCSSETPSRSLLTLTDDAFRTASRSILDIATPSMDSLLGAQLMDLCGSERADVLLWTYALLGRLLFETNTLEKWHVLPIFVGRDASGMSLVATTLVQLYEAGDACVVSGHGEERFADLAEMWLCVIDATKHSSAVGKRLGLDEGQIQGIISGEPITLPRRHQSCATITWTTPLLIFCYELPSWLGSTAAIHRRLLPFMFDTAVPASQRDGSVQRKLEAELPHLLVKIACAYRLVANQFRGRVLSSSRTGRDLPSSLLVARRLVPQLFHPLSRFLRHSDTIRRKRACSGMPWLRFRELADKFCVTVGISRVDWKDTRSIAATLDVFYVHRTQLQPEHMDAGRMTLTHNGSVHICGTDWVAGVEEC